MGTIISPSVFRDVNGTSFNGTDEFVYKDSPTGLANTEGFLSFWYRPTTVLGVNGGRAIIAFYDTASAAQLTINLRRSVSVGSVNRIEISVRNNNALVYTVYAGTTTTITAGSLYHVVIRCSGGAYAMWINGTAQTINPWFSEGGGQDPLWSGGMTAITSPRLAFGRSSGSYSDCKLNEIVLGTAAINSTQVGQLYNSGTPRNPHRVSGLGMTHWYRMGDSRDDATTIYDEIGGNNLTLVNMDASNYVTP